MNEAARHVIERPPGTHTKYRFPWSAWVPLLRLPTTRCPTWTPSGPAVRPEPNIRVPHRYNRPLLYTATGYWGSTLEDKRMTAVFFWMA
ncbi:hypothetical protein ACFV2Q_02240 [Streptomyces sp. NPDC059650]|uniref:hypothetical protein n=1 Tax=Streptomyces sp. NPDC059650 TaxID=3346896 RepID=UPI0036AA1952